MVAAVPLGSVLVWIGALANLVCPLPMLLATCRGEQRPSRVSFSVWTAEAVIAFCATIAAGAGIGARIVTGAFTVMLGAVFAATFVPTARVRWQRWRRGDRLTATTTGRPPATARQRRVDRTCLALSVAALVGWRLTDDPGWALGFTIAADAVACIPTFASGWRGEESPLPFLGFSINAACAFLVIQDWRFAEYGYTYYGLVACVALTVIPWLRNRPAVGRHRRPDPAWWAATTRWALPVVLATVSAFATGVVAGAISPEHPALPSSAIPPPEVVVEPTPAGPSVATTEK